MTSESMTLTLPDDTLSQIICKSPFDSYETEKRLADINVCLHVNDGLTVTMMMSTEGRILSFNFKKV